MKTNKKVMLSIALLMVNSAAFASEGFKDKAKRAASNALSKVADSMPTVDGAKQAVANGAAKAVNFVKVNAPTVAGTKQAVSNVASSAVDAVKSHPIATGAIVAGTVVVAGVVGTQKGRNAVKSAKDAVVTGVSSAATKTKAAVTNLYDRMPNMPTFRRARVATPTQLPPMTTDTDAAQDDTQDAGNQDQGTLQNTTPVAEQQEQIAAQVEALNQAEQNQEAIRENAAQAGREAAEVANAKNAAQAEVTTAPVKVKKQGPLVPVKTWKQTGSAALNTLTRGYAGTSIAKQEEAARIELAKQEEAAKVAREQAFINDAVKLDFSNEISAISSNIDAYIIRTRSTNYLNFVNLKLVNVESCVQSIVDILKQNSVGIADNIIVNIAKYILVNTLANHSACQAYTAGLNEQAKAIFTNLV